MGILQAAAAIGRTLRPALATASALPSGIAITSVPADVLEAFGVHVGSTVTRKQAMSVPAMRRARSIVCGTIGTLPLQAQRPNGTGQLVPVERGATATLLSQLDPATTPQWTLTWTVDDLFFSGLAWWHVIATDAQGWPLAVRRVTGRVTVNGGKAFLDGRPMADRELIRFDGPDQGLLVDGANTLQTCLLLEAAVRRNATGLPPMDILMPAEGAPDLDDTEAAALVSKWRSLRASNGTGWLNRSTEHKVVGFDARAGQLVEARQQQAVEVARMTNLDAGELNAPAGSGMTYINTEAKRRDLLDVSLGQYLAAIFQRLSMPDVTPRGQQVRFDTAAFLRGTTADAIKAAVEATGGPVMTPEESRQGLLQLPGTPTMGTLSKAPAPAPQEEPA